MSALAIRYQSARAWHLISLQKVKKEVVFDVAKATVIARAQMLLPPALSVCTRTRARDRAKNAESKSCSVSKRHETSAEFFFFPFLFGRTVGRRTPRPFLSRLGSIPAAAAAAEI